MNTNKDRIIYTIADISAIVIIAVTMLLCIIFSSSNVNSLYHIWQ